MQGKFRSIFDEIQNRDINDLLEEAYNGTNRRNTEVKSEGDKAKDDGTDGQAEIAYDEGIMCKRLIDGKFYDVTYFDLDDDNKMPDLVIEQSVFRDLYERYLHAGSKKNDNSNKRLDKVVKRAISNVKEMTSIKVFKLTSLVWIASIAVMSAFQLIYSNAFFSNVSNLIDIMLESNKQFLYFTKVNTNLLDLEFLSL